MTTQIALIAVEGVLANGDDLRSAPSHRWSRPLYDGIRSQFRTVAMTNNDQDLTRGWLKREGLASWSAVLSNTTPLGYGDWKVEQVRDFQANGWEVAFLLDCDRDVCVVAQSMGVLTLSVGSPLNWPGWKPEGTGFQPWNTLPDTLESSP